ncbi:MAG: hypothetical protein R3343_09720 [Nitriliruptorales bacterium]|nr:hypothetical protein [Nitriliruptorales bacterium]
MIFARKPEPDAPTLEAWRAFLDCAEVVEGGRRLLLSTLPTGRVEPAPIGVGIEAMRKAIADADGWMDRWKVDELEDAWDECREGLQESEAALGELEHTAATTSELEELLEAVENVVAPLDAFADAEREWRRRWRLPK